MKRFFTIAAVFLPIVALYLLGGLELLDRSWTDTQFRLARRSATSDVVLVDIDPKSLRSLDVWPWPRGYHATVLDNLVEAGAERVAFDIEFSSRSIAEEDAEFSKSLRAAEGRVVLPVFHRWQHAGHTGPRMVAAEPLEEFQRYAILGTINVQPDTDGKVRRYKNRDKVSGRLVPAFASALAGDPRPDVTDFYLDFGIISATVPRVSYIDVLAGRFDPEQVRGKAVIVGATAVELGDLITVPTISALPGPLVQAIAFESLVQDRTLERLSPTATLLGTLLLILILGNRLENTGWRMGLLITVICCCCVLIISIVVMRFASLIIDASPWALAFVGLYGFGLVRRIDQQALGLLSQNLRIHHTESLMQHVVENSFDAIVTLGERGIIETFNGAAAKMFGFRASDVLGRPLSELVHHSESGGDGSLFARATAAPIEAVGRGLNGRSFPVELVVTVIDTGEDPKLVAVLRDITERKSHQEALQHQATHDPLTDLPNRFLLHERVEAALVRAAACGHQVSILLLDLDRFKEINDALGHHTGDLLLQQVARRLETPLKPTETIARLGGDEFAVLIPETDTEEAKALASKLIEMLKAPFHVERLSLQIDTSIGVAVFPDHGEDAETLIQRADVAMYVAKNRRTGCALYQHDEDFNSIRHLMLRGDLRKAIEEDGLSLVYQPKISAATGHVIGVEALLRWQHPEHGNIPADEFIRLAEHSGLIQSLTQWVIFTATQQGSQWVRQGLELNMSVNLSARNLLEKKLPEELDELLAQSGMPPELLTLEITESVIMEDPDRALEVVTRLRQMGLDISIDDFGTGYSSLGYLMKLPAQEIKIDKSFVIQMDEDPGSATIVHSTIELAHNLGLKVVAEGVETQEVWETLRELGCDIGQGYFFSRPQPPAQFLEWLESFERTVPDFVMAPVLEAAHLQPILRVD